jgi:hypothetical protein
MLFMSARPALHRSKIHMTAIAPTFSNSREHLAGWQDAYDDAVDPAERVELLARRIDAQIAQLDAMAAMGATIEPGVIGALQSRAQGLREALKAMHGMIPTDVQDFPVLVPGA